MGRRRARHPRQIAARLHPVEGSIEEVEQILFVLEHEPACAHEVEGAVSEQIDGFRTMRQDESMSRPGVADADVRSTLHDVDERERDITGAMDHCLCARQVMLYEFVPDLARRHRDVDVGVI